MHSQEPPRIQLPATPRHSDTDTMGQAQSQSMPVLNTAHALAEEAVSPTRSPTFNHVDDDRFHTSVEAIYAEARKIEARAVEKRVQATSLDVGAKAADKLRADARKIEGYSGLANALARQTPVMARGVVSF